MLSESPAWKHLASLATRSVNVPLAKWLEGDGRFDRFSFDGPALLIDLSKQRMDDAALAGLMSLARERDLPRAIDALFSGAPVNRTEKRPALHTQLRAPVNSSAQSHDVHETLRRVRALADEVRDGRRRGATNKPFNHIVHIGIGGSHLGPELAVQALAPSNSALQVRFVANIDPGELGVALEGLDPERTLFIVASKSFSTLETLKNTEAARSWLLERSDDPTAVADHFVAITSNVAAACEFGIDRDNVYPMWDWVGGRYSLWSAVGMPIVLSIGSKAFDEFLAGAHAMDEHFHSTDPEHNLPVLLALAGIWNYNFLGVNNHAILPYNRHLQLLPAYLQQLEMESNGKSVDVDGVALKIHSAPILWGGVGTNGQHAFHQLLHQGTRSYTADFVMVGASAGRADERQQWLLANGLAQSQAMMAGNDDADPHRKVTGGHATTTIVMDSLNPFALGSLLSLYEHKVFCQGVIWNINSFDQFGVELGKRLALPIYQQLGGNSAINQDASTKGLIARLRNGVSDG
jgi:glucose-6-phosphate isomerase